MEGLNENFSLTGSYTWAITVIDLSVIFDNLNVLKQF